MTGCHVLITDFLSTHIELFYFPSKVKSCILDGEMMAFNASNEVKLVYGTLTFSITTNH